MLPGGLHLSKSEGLAVGDEHRIISETLVAARRPDQMAEHLALEGVGGAVGPRKAQHGREVGAWARLLGPGAALAHLVGQPLHREPEVPLRTGPARRRAPPPRGRNRPPAPAARPLWRRPAP